MTGRVSPVNWLPEMRVRSRDWRRRADWLARRGGVTIRPFSKKDFQAEVERCYQVYNDAQKDHWGFVELTGAEFLYFARQLAKIVCNSAGMLRDKGSHIWIGGPRRWSRRASTSRRFSPACFQPVKKSAMR